MKEAREKRETAKEKLANGVDLGKVRKAKKRSAATNAENSFEAVAREWHTKFTADQ
ncbi:hypothetical protein HHL24_21205 [Paraburkholderia sp. RP-4-7]|uniref:Uncharacterized protein n=1 Tax=Paraburkholderia polaris TaxID=2728848 RepID=A0A848IL43_9BURK|nr:hypothetical protein [Paraburkholderia polaris]